MFATIMVLGVIFFFALWYALSYNGLVSAQNAIDQSWSNVEVELKRRLDLIPNLVETVKGYAGHEHKTFQDVVEARGKAVSSSGPAAASASEGMLTQALRGLFAVAEAYPNLKADARFQQLQEELANVENRIAERRNGYNQTVNFHKNLCQSFPSLFVARFHGFTPRPFFDAPDELAEKPPTVSFS